ncbi:hypothetical protein AVEN_247119-1 [Araneus ventricosus]|uniref:Uncharacterized protein n=1 Tax=Araneus ventricosus TaxID=182803 RepID=A0A4Y2FU47_ARAVE|nr:hypothetical protein AVEN_247119-1 [Araneus ventricosus]
MAAKETETRVATGDADTYIVRSGSTLTSERYREEILDPHTRLYAGATVYDFIFMEHYVQPGRARPVDKYLEEVIEQPAGVVSPKLSRILSNKGDLPDRPPPKNCGKPRVLLILSSQNAAIRKGQEMQTI